MALSWYIVKAEKEKPDNRCRKWRIVVRKAGGGTRSETFRGTKTDAKKRAPFFAAEVEAELPAASSTLRGLCGPWLDLRLASGDITPSTRRSYGFALDAYAAVADAPIGSATAADVDACTAALVANGRSRATVKSYAAMLGACFAHAVDVGAVAADPMASATVPRGASPSKGVSLPGASVREVLDVPPYCAQAFAVGLIARSGLRVGEAVSLAWSDWDGRCLRVRASKSAAGVRSVPLDEGSAAFVADRLARVEAVAGRVPPDAQMCCREDLAPTSAQSVRGWWTRNRDGLGCPGARLHDLRHTYLTNLAQAGVHPAVMQRLAGHSAPTVALRIYTHVQDSDLAAAVDALAASRADC